RLAEARAAFQAALACVVAVGDRWFEGVFEGWLGDLAAEDRDWHEAARSYERASVLLDLAGERPYAALFGAALELARAWRDGQPARAAAPDIGARPRTVRAAMELHRSHAALARDVRGSARDARSSPAAAGVAFVAALEAADRPGQDGMPVASSSDDVRFAARI